MIVCDTVYTLRLTPQRLVREEVKYVLMFIAVFICLGWGVLMSSLWYAGPLIHINFLFQRWIKKKSYRLRHKRKADDVKDMPVRKKLKVTPWQHFMKQFGESEGKHN